jgi:hypothetical protein
MHPVSAWCSGYDRRRVVDVRSGRIRCVRWAVRADERDDVVRLRRVRAWFVDRRWLGCRKLRILGSRQRCNWRRELGIWWWSVGIECGWRNLPPR